MSIDATSLPDTIKTPEELKQVVDCLMKGAKLLTDLASSYGFVLTISTSPKQPLAMGNYKYECELRVSHDVYRSES